MAMKQPKDMDYKELCFALSINNRIIKQCKQSIYEKETAVKEIYKELENRQQQLIEEYSKGEIFKQVFTELAMCGEGAGTSENISSNQ